MGSICQISDSVCGGNKDVEFIQCVDGREPQTHKIWCLGSNSVTRDFHPTAQIDVGSETSRQFSTQYFAKNCRIIPVIGQTSVNRSVEILGIPYDAWEFGLPFLENILAPTMPRGWGDNDNSNKNWPVIPGGPYHNISLHGVVPPLPVLLTYPGVRRIRTLLRTVPVMNPFVVGIVSA